jgi:hypothetical protein
MNPSCLLPSQWPALRRFTVLFALGAALASPARAIAAEPENFRPLFNGRDLSGWVPVNVAPNTFTVRDGMIYSTGVPTGVMRTDRHYENFILELEWQHLKPGGNAGLFVWSDPITSRGVPFTRSVEVQIIDGNDPAGLWTGHGDLFPIHGATFVPDRPHPKGWMRCLPSENRANPAGQWNHYRVECRDGRVTLAVNGKVVSGGSQSKPRKGYICLESEGGPIYYRNLRIQELPSSNPPAVEVAGTDQGFVSLYTGVDLNGWQVRSGRIRGWQASDWTLRTTGATGGDIPSLWTTKSLGDFELILDWRLTSALANANGSGVCLRGSETAVLELGNQATGSGSARGTPAKARADKPPGEWNRLEIQVRGGVVTARLNGLMVSEKVSLPGLPGRGPIGLMNPAASMEFANLYYRELP